jgi:hypothetical protein
VAAIDKERYYRLRFALSGLGDALDDVLDQMSDGVYPRAWSKAEEEPDLSRVWGAITELAVVVNRGELEG